MIQLKSADSWRCDHGTRRMYFVSILSRWPLSVIHVRFLQVETREDEEQNVKLTEILELLVAAGYFRARIKGLSPFDKVRESLANHSLFAILL